MRSIYKDRWHPAFVLISGVQAMTLFTPRATEPIGIDLAPPFPTVTALVSHGFGHLEKTRFAPASDCGYWGDRGTYTCDNNYACRFHSSHAEYPGMVGCCPKDPLGLCDGFYSTCYGRQEISKTPSLLSSTDDLFAIFCTEDVWSYCLPRTWPEIGVSAFECTNFTLGATATVHTISTYTDASVLGITVVSAVSIPWIKDHEMIMRLNFNPTKAATTHSSRSTVINMAGPSSGPSLILVGAVVGSVVGGFVALSTMVIILWILRKRKISKNNLFLSQQSSEQCVSVRSGSENQASPPAERKKAQRA
ncbi:hypothetical protein ANOM_000007 [Aspergillus nomiae NRRL 13137]|uniref:Uncharacterized protein n=1 Tax=Aspergillus nomiae NRRL (strain ATCC 15546 / NRRL 13137 / CBS 260.88 / M93) TaxID=1509407 RepID=A0A0L1JIJ3_ASPN3|nr:uncharacterized protein ANOM_000007 [Aspergillus nomiae NRRL 13137]KNG91585.1 hypothetical protein ANOM_000007 [Aspergillus nomiae NRRL 13137]